MRRLTVDQMREAGFEDQEISEFVEGQRISLRSAGFKDEEIDDFYGIKRPAPGFDFTADFGWETIAGSADRQDNEMPWETLAAKNNAYGKALVEFGEQAVKWGVSVEHGLSKSMGQALVELEEILLYAREKDRQIRSLYDRSAQREYTEEENVNWVQGIISKAATKFLESEEYWQGEIDKRGRDWMSGFVSDVAGLPVGVTEFVAGGVPYAVAGGMKEAAKEGKNELTWGLLYGGKRWVLGKFFKFIHPWNKWLKAVGGGTLFATEATMQTDKPGEITKQGLIGFLFPLLSPGQKMGLNEYRQELVKRRNGLLSTAKRAEMQKAMGEKIPLTTIDDAVDISRTAVMHEGRVYTSSLHERAAHILINQEHNLTEKGVIRGYIDKNGSFIATYPEEAVRMIQEWEQRGIKVGDTFVHFRSTQKRVKNVLDPDQHMGLIHGSEKKLAANYGLEKEGGLMINRIYGYKSPADREGVIPGRGVYIGRFNGPVLSASSETARKLMGEAIREIEGKPREVPGLTFAEQQTFGKKRMTTAMGPNDRMLVAKMGGKDVGFIWVTASEKGFEVRKIEVQESMRQQGVGENLLSEARNQFGKYLPRPEARTELGKKFFEAQEGKGKYAPQDYNAMQLIFERKARDAGYVALDTETQQGYKIFTPQRVINVSDELVDLVYNNLLRDKGITYDLMGNRDMVGTRNHAVSTYPERTRPIEKGKFTREDVRNFIIDNRDLFTLDGNNFGGWETDTHIVMDISRAISNQMDAVRLGKRYGQEAIYDLEARQEINVDQAYASMQEAMMGGRIGLPGIPEGEPETRQRKFIKTVKDSMTTEEQLRKNVGEIQPQDYEVLRDKDALAAAEFRTSTADGITQAIQDLEKGDIPMRDVGYVAHTLMKKLQDMGDYERASHVVDLIDYTRRDAGRLVRSASLWGNSMGFETFIRWAQKQLDVVNAKRSWIDVHIGGKVAAKDPVTGEVIKTQKGKIKKVHRYGKVTLTEFDKTEIQKKFIEMQKMPEGVEKVNAFLQIVDYVAQKVPPGISEMISAFRYQNMLSGIKTHERNTLENMTNAFITRPWDLTMQGEIDYFGSLITGRKARKAYVKSAGKYWKEISSFNQLSTAMTAFRMAWRGDLPIEKPELLGAGIKEVSLFESRRQRMMPKALTISQRFMEAQDRFFTSLIAAGEKAAQINNGLSEADATAKGQEIGQRYLYRERMGMSRKDLSIASQGLLGIGYGIEQMRRIPVAGKMIEWAIPFLRTPINKGITMIEYASPLTLVRTPSHWTTEAGGRIAAGTIITAMGSLAALFGETTWTPPTDEEGKKYFYATERKPFSVKLGENWVPFWYLGPFALAFAVPAAIKHYYEESNKSLTATQYEMLLQISAGVARFIASQSSAQMIGTFFAMVSGDVEYSIEKNLTYMFGQLIPGQGMLRWISQIIDPVYRQSVHAVDELVKQIPFWSKTLPAHEKPFGEISKRDPWNLGLPFDIGFSDMEGEEDWEFGAKDYESLYQLEIIRSRFQFLQHYQGRIRKQLREGKISQEEYDRLLDRAYEGLDKAVERMEKDLEGEEEK